MLRPGLIPTGSYYSTDSHIMNHVYPIDKDVAAAKKRLGQSSIPKEVQNKILEFVSYVKESAGIGPHREYFYYTRLQTLGLIMGKNLLDPQREDVIQAIAELRETKTIRGTYYSPATISDFKKVLKKFQMYLHDGEIPRFWRDIHSEKIGPRYSKPSDMITYVELQTLLEACRNKRDKALISLLWDSGIRASELLLLKVKDFQRSKDQLYASLNIDIGSKNYKNRGVVLIGDSVVLVDEWIKEKKREPEDFLFIGIGKENAGKPLNYDDLSAILKKVRARSGLKKKIAPHLFRHTAATRWATEIPPQVLVKQMGWASVKMADNYTHMDQQGQTRAILMANGIEVTDEELRKPLHEIPRKCPRCHDVNTGAARFCNNCGSPLRMDDFQKVEAERQATLERMRNTIQQSGLVSDDYKEMLTSIVGEDGQKQIMQMIMDKLASKIDTREDFKEEFQKRKNNNK